MNKISLARERRNLLINKGQEYFYIAHGLGENEDEPIHICSWDIKVSDQLQLVVLGFSMICIFFIKQHEECDRTLFLEMLVEKIRENQDGINISQFGNKFCICSFTKADFCTNVISSGDLNVSEIVMILAFTLNSLIRQIPGEVEKSNFINKVIEMIQIGISD